ncbi:sulfatase-like hydrolase/transferase [Taibaiella soli]|uniref:Sulfatase n=1 Tax=Taibaiella soli TaxID=1649169 RepID=A0A2W2AV08_9BACT|nr:sulfatase-like hydrolase/transferase [Taibaiella soli]PZF71518.1 sulfatase [Taibaiella soli]
MPARLFRILLPVFMATILPSITWAKPPQPNIILIVADDLGYSDLSSYGNTHLHTPFIDGLGKDGIRFEQAYATAPICGPSRAAIMTGRYQQRFGNEFMPFDIVAPDVAQEIKRHYLEPWNKTEGVKMLHPHVFIDRSKYKTGLPATEITIAELLHDNGYVTGLVGKWNLGNGGGYYPDRCGYDYSYYFPGALTRYVDEGMDTSRYVNQHLPWSFSELPAWAPRFGATAIYEGRKQVRDTGYLTFSFAQKAIDFIEANKKKQFFLTLTFNAPHDPFQAPRANYDRIKNVDDRVKRVYYAMIEALDDAVGDVLQKLKETGNMENTLIIFISDNGGATYTRATDNAPLRGGKCTQFDGGLRVPMFMQYPKEIRGGQVYKHPVSALDIFTTIVAAADVSMPENRTYDGVDLMGLVKHPDSVAHPVLYFRNGYAKAVRKDNWKLYINEHDKETFLFDLNNDPSELKDLSRQQKEKVEELKKDLQTWEKTQTISPLWPSAADVIITVNGKQCFFPS